MNREQELAEENARLHLYHAELMSLKQSIMESGLKEYMPTKKGVSFHDRIVLAIGKLVEDRDFFFNKLIHNGDI